MVRGGMEKGAGEGWERRYKERRKNEKEKGHRRHLNISTEMLNTKERVGAYTQLVVLNCVPKDVHAFTIYNYDCMFRCYVICLLEQLDSSYTTGCLMKYPAA